MKFKEANRYTWQTGNWMQKREQISGDLNNVVWDSDYTEGVSGPTREDAVLHT